MRVEEHLRHGLMAHQAGSLEAAERHYRAVLADDPRSFPAAHLLGILCVQRRNFTEAEGLLRLALTLNPNDAATLQNYAVTLLALERYTDVLTLTARLDPNSATVWHLRGSALHHKGQF